MFSHYPITWWLAWRFLRGKSEQSITLMIRICFIGIFLGTGALTLVAAIMNGFERATYEKLKGVHADIIIRSAGKPINYEKLEKVMHAEFQNIVAATSPQAQSHALVVAHEDTTPVVVAIIGIDPRKHKQVSTLEHTLKNGIPLEKALENNQVLIGEQLAQQLAIYEDHPQLSLLFVPHDEDTNTSNATVTLTKTQVTLGGIFKTGIDEYDTNVIYCSLELFESLFPQEGITQVGVRLIKDTPEKTALSALKKRLNGLFVCSWHDLYPALVAALALQRYATFIVLALITLVASMSIVSLLSMMITHKQSTIALLLTLGMSRSNIMTLFSSIALIIAGGASILGIIIASGAAWFLNHYPLIQLPDVYFTTHLPAHITFDLVSAVFITTLSLSLLAIWISVRRLRSLSLVMMLKNQG